MGGTHSTPFLTVENYATRGLRSLCDTWYCGHVSLGRERLLERKLHRFGIQTYLPVHNRKFGRTRYDYRTRTNLPTSYIREFPLFPGYVFAAFDQTDWPLIRERISLKPRWLDFGSGPVQIPIDLIEDLQQREVNGFVPIITQDYAEGDELEITEPGIWYGRRGLLASDPDRRVLTLCMIAESYALRPTQVVTRLKIEREYVRRATLAG